MTNETAEEPQLRAGCYCRISSDPNDKRQGVDRQRDDTTALCEAKGWSPAGFYIDNDRSASNGKQRPEWDRLLADVAAGKIDAIAVWNQDRGWRQMSELEELRKFFAKLGRKILLSATVIGDIDLDDPYSVHAAQNRTSASELETAVLKIRIRRAARSRAERGIPQWRRAFGYLGDTYEPDPKTAPLVVEAYRAILAGASLGDICRMWNEAGAYTLNGKKWTQPQVSNFLRKARNAGLRSHNGEIVGLGTWPPLVDESLWKSVQSVLSDSRRKPGRKSVQRHLLTGVLRCGKEGCGGYLAGKHTLDKRITYSCKSCRGVAIRAEDIEPLLYRLIGDRLAQEDAVDLLRAEIHDEGEAEAIRTELNELYGELEKIGVERGQRLLTGAQARVATDIVQADIEALEAKQQSDERVRMLADIPLGRPEARAAIKRLSPDRFRAVINLLMAPTVMPVGRGSHNRKFNPGRVHENWHQSDSVPAA